MDPGTGTSMKNGYSIVGLRIKKDPFFKDIFSNFTSFLCENKEKSELNCTPTSAKQDIFRNFTPFSHENKDKSGLKFTLFFKSNQIKLKSNILF